MSNNYHQCLSMNKDDLGNSHNPCFARHLDPTIDDLIVAFGLVHFVSSQ